VDDPSQEGGEGAQDPAPSSTWRGNSVVVGLLIDALAVFIGWAFGSGEINPYGWALGLYSAIYMLMAALGAMVVGVILAFRLRTRRIGAGMLLGFGATLLLVVWIG